MFAIASVENPLWCKYGIYREAVLERDGVLAARELCNVVEQNIWKRGKEVVGFAYSRGCG
jgi:hypothetical protein